MKAKITNEGRGRVERVGANEPAERAGGRRTARIAKFGWTWAIAYLLTATVICYLPALLPGRTFLTADVIFLTPPWLQHGPTMFPGWHKPERAAWDPIYQFYASRMFLADSIRAGVVPWHNPYSNSGTPFIADDQSAFFYPINWLFAILPLASAFGIVSALNTFLAGVFFSLFARRKGLGWEAALAGATVWMFCGAMAAWQMWQVVDATLCWLPLALYFADLIVFAHPRGVPVDFNSIATAAAAQAGLAVSIGMILVAGHLQFACCDLFIVAAYGLFGLAAHRSARSAARLLVGVLVGFGVGAAQTIPTLDLLHNSLRDNYSPAQLLQTALPPAQLALIAMPELAGGVRDWLGHPFLGAVNYYELTCYVGASSLVFGTLAFGSGLRTRRSEAWYWLVVAIVGLLIGCGTPVYAALYYCVPLFKSFHGVARMTVMAEFAVSALCALGVQAVIDCDGWAASRKHILRTGGAAALSAIALYGIAASQSVAALWWMLTHDWLLYGLTQLARALVLIVAATAVAIVASKRFAWAAVALVAVDMLWFAAALNPGSPAQMLYPNLPIIDSIRQISAGGRVLTIGEGKAFTNRMEPNSAMALGLSDVGGSDPLLLANYDRFTTALSSATQLTPIVNRQDSFAYGDCAALNYVNARAIVSPIPLIGTHYAMAAAKDVVVYSNPRALGEAWLAGSWTVNPDQPSAMARIFSPNPGPTVFVSEPPRFGSRTIISRMPVHGGAGAVVYASHAMESADAGVTVPSPDVVVFSEIADPAWKAFVDGRAVDWLTVDGMFMGVPIVSGQHSIHLEYLSGPGRIGLYLACGSWLLVAGFLGFAAMLGLSKRH